MPLLENDVLLYNFYMSYTVAIIDDSRLIRNQLETFFSEIMGYNVIAVGRTGEDAVRVVKEEKPNLITLDYTMPVLNGFEAIKKIREFDALVKILIISVIKDKAKVIESLELGASEFISKPFSLTDSQKVEDVKGIVQSLF